MQGWRVFCLMKSSLLEMYFFFKMFYVFLENNMNLFVPVLQQNYLAQVTSNIWGTKFKIVGLATFLPSNLGAGKKPKTIPLVLSTE